MVMQVVPLEQLDSGLRLDGDFIKGDRLQVLEERGELKSAHVFLHDTGSSSSFRRSILGNWWFARRAFKLLLSFEELFL